MYSKQPSLFPNHKSPYTILCVRSTGNGWGYKQPSPSVLCLYILAYTYCHTVYQLQCACKMIHTRHIRGILCIIPVMHSITVILSVYAKYQTITIQWDHPMYDRDTYTCVWYVSNENSKHFSSPHVASDTHVCSHALLIYYSTAYVKDNPLCVCVCGY